MLAASADEHSPAAGERVSLALRHSLFEDGRDIADDGVLLRVAAAAGRVLGIGQSGRVSDLGHEHCKACGFDGSAYDDASLVASIDDLRSRWRRLLSEAGSGLRIRPDPRTWSAIEYAAHSRDITALHVFGAEQALAEDEPVYPAIDGDALIEASAATYGEEDLDTVLDQLDVEVRRLRDLAANTAGGAWERGITIGDNRSTIRRLLEHALHDSLHHIDDVQRGLVIIRGWDVAP